MASTVVPSVVFVIVLLGSLSVNPVSLDKVNVNTKLGSVVGSRSKLSYDLGEGTISDTLDTFRGVPYAKPPVGTLRWKPPVPVDAWMTPHDATYFRQACPQVTYFHHLLQFEHQDEDCLYLNVYTPFQPSDPERRYPVMVWIHGGSYETMSGKLYDGSTLALYGVVVVTINYRLGLLGFLSSGDGYLSGNYGFLDQIEALRWVQQYIHHFRGDPGRVTLFGQSAGGSSIGLMMMAKPAEGLFHRCIIQSGPVLGLFAVHDRTRDFTQYIRAVAKLFNCTGMTMESIVACLRNVPWKHFITLRHEFPWYNPMSPEFRPAVDDVILTASPRERLRAGRVVNVPVMIGTVQEEFDNYFDGGERHKNEYDRAMEVFLGDVLEHDRGMINTVKYAYTDWRRDHESSSSYGDFKRGEVLSDMHMVAPSVQQSLYLSKAGLNIYQYHFYNEKCYHSVELNYVFGSPFTGVVADELGGNLSVNFTDQDREYSRVVMRTWTSFASKGEPFVKQNNNQIIWTPFDPQDRSYMYISPTQSQMKNHLRAQLVALWNVLLPKLRTFIPKVKESESHPNFWLVVAFTCILLLAFVLLIAYHIRTQRAEPTVTSRRTEVHAPPPVHV